MITYTREIRPSAKDTWLIQPVPDSNSGILTQLCLFNLIDQTYRSILEFDLSNLPLNITITSASLQLYYYYSLPTNISDKTVWVYKLTRPDWVETEATWNSYKSGSAWTNPGGDYVTSYPSGGSKNFPASYGWMTWNVLDIVRDAYDEGKPAEFLVKFETEGLSTDYTIARFRSNNYTTNPLLQPKLVIQYTIPVTTYTLEIRNSSGVLIAILENAHNISFTQQINAPHVLRFALPASDSKIADITLANEIWLRDNRTDAVMRKFILQREWDIRE